MKLSMGYPNYSDELEIMDKYISKDPLENIDAVISQEEIKYVQNNYNQVHVDEKIRKYILDLVVATRNNAKIELGCSPRATLNLLKGCQGLAAIRGRDYVILEDVKEIAVAIMSHRIILKDEISGIDNKNENIIKEILSTVETPINPK